MDRLKRLITEEPMRLYQVAKAVLAVVVYVYTDVPVELILGVVAALLGVDEMVRAAVTPNPRAEAKELDAYHIGLRDAESRRLTEVALRTTREHAERIRNHPGVLTPEEIRRLESDAEG